MIKKSLFILLSLLFLKVDLANADVTQISSVSATVVGTTLGPAIQISPANNSASNSAKTTFIWQRPSPLPSTSLDHYVLYIDNAAYTSSVSDSLTSEDFYFYTSSATSGVFTVSLKTDLAQGYHTWKVIVYDNAGQSTSSSDWTFYIDSIAPFISLTHLNSTTYSWTTADPTTIPDESLRHLVSNTSVPIIKGEVETNANLQINISCPATPPFGCTNQTYLANSTDGKWQKQLSTLLAETEYIVTITATDAAGNSTIFPTFYITYTTSTSGTITTSPTPTSTQIPIATISAQLTPPPELAALITPTPFTSKIAPSPTLPPQKTTKLKTAYAYGPYLMLLFLCLGLPLHLALTGFAINTNFRNIFRFLFTLGFPFLKKQGSNTIPFSFIEIYDSNNLSARPHRALSDIKGNIYYPNNLPKQILIKASNTNFIWNTQVANNTLLTNSCLLLLPKKIIGAKEKLQNSSYRARLIPLIVAILSSAVGVIIYRNIYIIIYLYLSLQYSFSEYYYPKIKKI